MLMDWCSTLSIKTIIEYHQSAMAIDGVVQSVVQAAINWMRPSDAYKRQ